MIFGKVNNNKKYISATINLFHKKYNSLKLLHYYIISYYIIFFSIKEVLNIFNNICEITITLKGKGDQKILSTQKINFGNNKYSTFNNTPDKLLINNISQNYTGKYVYNLSNEVNNITLIWKEKFTFSYGMFTHLNNITHIYFTSFDTSLITNMRSMFNGCSSLTSLDLTNFNTSLVSDTNYMFYNCSSLISLNLNNFDTSLVVDMYSMFYNCCSLISLNIDNFNTTLVTDFGKMFYNCASLISLNLHSFSNYSLEKKNSMFQDINPNIIFCINEDEIGELAVDYKRDCNDTCFINKDHKLIIEKNKCVDKCIENNQYIYEYNNVCFEHCPNETYYYINDENVKLCLDFIPEGYYLNDSTIYKCNIKCKNCTLESTLNDLCLFCNNKKDYYSIINHSNHENNDDKFSNCINENPLGYFFDYNESIYKPCYNTCKSCSSYGNITDNKCLSCYNNYTLSENNCYKDCQYYHYFDSSNIYHCTINNSCPNEYNNIIIDKKQCIDLCNKDEEYFYEYNNICYKSNPHDIFYDNDITTNILDEENINPDSMNINISNDNNYNNFAYITYEINNNISYDKISNTEMIFENSNNISYEKNSNTYIIYDVNNNEVYNKNSNSYIYKTYDINNNDYINEILVELLDINNSSKTSDDILNDIKNKLSNHTFDELISYLINGQKESFTFETSNIIFQLSTTKNKLSYYKNISVILLGECEEKLKEYYNISQNKSLLMLQLDIYVEGILIPIVEYEVYNIETKKKLDLNVCEGINIKILRSANVNEEELFKYDKNNDYYNDICFTYTTKKGTDITIYDRKKEFIKNNMSLCEVNCEFQGYNKEIKKSECDCQLKIKIPLISEIVINKDILLNNFIDIKRTVNLKVMNCYKMLFTKNGLIYNIGSYILLLIILISLVCLFIFIFRDYKLLFNSINLLQLKKNQGKKNIINRKEIKKRAIIQKKKKYNSLKNKKIKKDINNKKIKNKNNPPKIKKFKVRDISEGINKLKTSGEDSNGKFSSEIQIQNILINNNKKQEKKEQYYLNDYELNVLLTYKEALELDKRTFLQLYFSLLRRRHLLIFSFYTYDDFNSRGIKISLFFFSFELNYTINALFFNDSTMHIIYIGQGNFNFIYQIAQILYSFSISTIINQLILYFSLSERNIIELKRTQINIKENISRTKKCLNIKFAIFFVLIFIFLIFFWYYISCFCFIYKNTQIYLIKSTLISFGFSLMYPFFLCFCPPIFRIPALKANKKDRECLYIISKVIQFF